MDLLGQAGRPTTTSSSRSSRARAPPAETRRITEWLEEHRPGVGRRGPPRRPAAVPVPVRHRVSGRAPGRRWQGIDVARARRASARRRSTPSTSVGIEHRPRPAHDLPAPLHRPHRPGRHRRPRRGRGGHDRGHGRSGCRAAAPARAAADGRGRRLRRRQLPAVHLLQPAVAGQAAERRAPRWSSSASSSATRAVRQMTNPVVDLVGDRTGRIVPIYPQSDKAGLVDLGAGRLDRRGARSGRASWSTRCRPSGATGSTLEDRTWAMQQIHAPESMATRQMARRRLVFDELLRLQLVLVMRKRRRRARRPGHPPPSSTARLVRRVPRPARLSPDRRPAAGHRRDRGRPGRPPPDAPAAAGRRRQRQDRRGGGRPARRRSRAATRARSWRRPRCWPSSTTSASGRCSTASPWPTTGRSCGERPLRGRAAHQPHDRRGAGPAARRAGRRRRSTS